MYQFTQSSPSSTWVIVHNIGRVPIVDVVIDWEGVLTKVLPRDVVHVDNNTLRVEFSSARSGEARLF